MGLISLKTDDIARLAPRFATPDFIERGRAQDLSLPIYFNGAIVAPDSATVTIFSSSGGEDDPVLAESACTIVSGIAIYSLDAADTSSLDLSDFWTEKWILVFTVDGESIKVGFSREAALVRTRLYPVVTAEDLANVSVKIQKKLEKDPAVMQKYIDASWKEVVNKLMEKGNRANLILSSYALRTAHLDLALAYVFTDFSASTKEGQYDKLSTMYFKKFEKDWARIKFDYDRDNDGIASEGRQNVARPIVLGEVPAYWV